MRGIALGLALGVACVVSTTQAQTLKVMKSLDAPHFDAHRTTWAPAADITNMILDTLVALDWDGRTVIPYLAKSWTISEDGKLYTFKLRDDVTFCSGKAFTSADVIYSFKRLLDPATKAPLKWRAGNVKELRAPDPATVEYELNEPYSDLMLNLASFSMAIHNQDSSSRSTARTTAPRRSTAPDHGALKPGSRAPKRCLRRHDAYRWGPSMYKNKGPVKFEKMVITIVPEDSSRLAAMMSGQFDITHNMPLQFLDQARKAPMLQVQEAKPMHLLNYFGFKTNRPLVADPRVREAMSIAIKRADIVKTIMQGNADPAYTIVDPEALDFNKGVTPIKEDVERAKKLLDEAGWKIGPGRLPLQGRRQAGAESLLHRGVLWTARIRGAAGLHAPDRRRLEHHGLRLHHRAGKDGRTRLRALDRDVFLSLGRRHDELLLRIHRTFRCRTGCSGTIRRPTSG